MEPTIPAEYTAVLIGAVACYGLAAFLLTQVLRRAFPIENNAARIVNAAIAAAFGIWAAIQYVLPIWPTIAPEDRVAAVLGLMGAIWWASQEIYRRLRADTWRTRANPIPQPWADQ